MQVDGVLFKFGMPMGPFSMGDLAGNDIPLKIRKSLGLLDPKTRPKGERYHGALGDRLCDMGRLGMKVGKGWYDYGPGRKRGPSAEVSAMIAAYRKEADIPQRSNISDEEILERCVYPLINEGFRCLEEGIALKPSDIDIVWVYGYGWPAYRGGPMYYADEIGLGTVLAGLNKYSSIHRYVCRVRWTGSCRLTRIPGTCHTGNRRNCWCSWLNRRRRSRRTGRPSPSRARANPSCSCCVEPGSPSPASPIPTIK